MGAETVHEAEVMELIELLFFAYRDFISDPDAILAPHGFGRAHHRVIHFVGRHPGMRVAELLDILRITKQSVARVLKELIARGYVIQRAGDPDRRRRLLYLTQKGAGLHASLMEPQVQRVRDALASAPGGDVRDVLFGLVDASDRAHVLSLIERASAAALPAGPRETWKSGL
jgi:DNA-binding MarR family transcriptional regulator